ncbi:hypothetical protein [Lewinella sp. IMCC34183]|uniref:hypothetical protein n=1 Tax=Lewinella sp. IMCC34183 TaxID=2248762 RepID=UPI000E26956A|nr:hypothetical protein [Lewinella sp. IMCC34183]
MVIKVDRLTEADSEEAAKALAYLLDSISSLNGTQIEQKGQIEEGKRGGFLDTNTYQVVVRLLEFGVLSAVYTAIKDCINIYRGISITLKFPDGSEMNMQNLSKREAYKIMKKHVEKDGQ